MAALPPPRGVPWNQTHDFIRLTRRNIPPGGQTAYTVPHRAGTTASDFTTFVYGQADVHIDNWPDIMYMLYPTDEWTTFKQQRKPPPKIDSNGQPVFEQWPRQGKPPRPLLQYDVLPDQVISLTPT